jgi:hypothetical protein
MNSKHAVNRTNDERLGDCEDRGTGIENNNEMEWNCLQNRIAGNPEKTTIPICLDTRLKTLEGYIQHQCRCRTQDARQNSDQTVTKPKSVPLLIARLAVWT